MRQDHYLLILAAGKGTRMHSQKPKVLHTLLGTPMLELVLHTASAIFGERIAVVTGFGAEEVESLFPHCNFIRQSRQLGTGDALKTALPFLQEKCATRLTVINGDMPLLSEDVLRDFLDKSHAADIAFASIKPQDAASYGRVVRRNNNLVGIVEARDYDPALHGPITGEVNSGVYDLRLSAVSPFIDDLKNDNESGEYYITDLISMGLNAGLRVEAVLEPDYRFFLGVNSPKELAEAEDILAERVNSKLLASGVTLHDCRTVRISPTVEIEPGVEISGPAQISGTSVISANSVIAPFCVIRDSEIRGATIESFSHITGAKIENGAKVGPYARLRPGAHLARNSHVGNFVELKKAYLGEKAKANHLAYIGDAHVGEGTNIGAGTITCNYDGTSKHNTTIGAHSFIGSNTALVAPVSIGNKAVIAAGSTITKDVKDNELGVARERQVNLPWRKK